MGIVDKFGLVSCEPCCRDHGPVIRTEPNRRQEGPELGLAARPQAALASVSSPRHHRPKRYLQATTLAAATAFFVRISAIASWNEAQK